MYERMMFPDFNDKKYKQLIKQQNFDEEKQQFLEQLIQEIEKYNTSLGIANNKSE